MTKTLEDMAHAALDVGKTVAAAVTGNDTEAARLARRREVRKQLGERHVLESKAAALAKRIAILHQQADRAADRHREVCAPLQAELVRLETEIVAAVADRQEIPSHAETRRGEIIEQINAENEALAEAAAKAQRLVGPLERESRETKVKAAELGVEGRLAAEGIGNPTLRARLFVSQHRAAAAQARLENAQLQLHGLPEALERARRSRVPERSFGWIREGGKLAVDAEAVAHYERRLRDWSAEKTAAAADLAGAQADAEEITRQLIDE